MATFSSNGVVNLSGWHFWRNTENKILDIWYEITASTFVFKLLVRPRLNITALAQSSAFGRNPPFLGTLKHGGGSIKLSVTLCLLAGSMANTHILWPFNEWPPLVRVVPYPLLSLIMDLIEMFKFLFIYLFIEKPLLLLFQNFVLDLFDGSLSPWCCLLRYNV